MSRPSRNTMTKWIGLTVGLAMAVVLLTSWRVPATSGTLGADVQLVATPPGELTLEPSGAFLQGNGLAAGGAAGTGRLELRNITGRTLAVSVRLLPSAADLDRALHVELGDAGGPVARGPLGKLRRWSLRTIHVGPGESKRLDARASIAQGAANYEGRIVDVTVELRARPVGR